MLENSGFNISVPAKGNRKEILGMCIFLINNNLWVLYGLLKISVVIIFVRRRGSIKES